MPDFDYADASAPGQVVVAQVFVHEVGAGLSLAYGDHPDIAPEDDRVVTEASPQYDSEILVVFSDRVVGLSEGEGPDATVPDGAVTLLCDGEPVELRSQLALYSPYGSQELDRTIGPESLGPQLRLFPTGMQMGSTCGIAFSDTVVGLDGERVCAPTDGLPTTPCAPGDASAIGFGVVPLRLIDALPGDGSLYPPDAPLHLLFNGDLDATSIDGITLEDDTGIVETVNELDVNEALVQLSQLQVLQRDTQYTIRVPAGAAGPRAAVGGMLGDQIVITFRTLP